MSQRTVVLFSEILEERRVSQLIDSVKAILTVGIESWAEFTNGFAIGVEEPESMPFDAQVFEDVTAH